MTKQQKQEQKKLVNLFNKGLEDYTGDKAVLIGGDEDLVTIALYHSTVSWVHYIIEVSLKHEFVQNVYNIHGCLTAYEMGRFEAIVKYFFEHRKDAE